MADFLDDGAGQEPAATHTDSQPAQGAQAAPVAAATPDAGTLLDAPVAAAEGDAKQPGETQAEWRARISGGDPEVAKLINRYSSEAAVGKALFSLRQKLSEGTIPKLGENAKPEEVAAFRKALGIPEKAEEYVVKTPANRELSDVEKPIIEDFRNLAHGLNIPPTAAAKMAEWFLGHNDRAVQVAQEQAHQKRQETEDKLRTEWGPEYRRNLDVANAYIEGQAPQLKGLLSVPLADGTRLGDNADFIRYVVDQARGTMGDAFVFDASQGQGGKSIDERIADINKMMTTDPKEYWNQATQDKLHALYQAKEKRGKAA